MFNSVSHNKFSRIHKKVSNIKIDSLACHLSFKLFHKYTCILEHCCDFYFILFQNETFYHDPTIQLALSSMTLCGATGQDITLTKDTQQIQEFFLLMAVCNTVVVSARGHHDKVRQLPYYLSCDA